MILGITGGVGTGKSTAAAELSRLGARVIDCDELARWLARYDTTVIAALAAAFPEAMLPNDVIDRARIAGMVFTDANRRAQLESILHPPVMGIVEANIVFARERGSHLVVDVPLLYEGGYAGLFDSVWVVSATAEVQFERLRARGGLTEQWGREIIAAQMPLSEKELQADRVIVNNGSLLELQRNVIEEWERLRREAQS